MLTNEQCFIRSYLETALWSSCDDAGNPLDDGRDLTDIHPDDLKSLTEQARAFFLEFESCILTDNAPLAEYWDGATDNNRKAAMAGHDFWLTRCGHGAGFWDGDWPEPCATELDLGSQAAGNVDLYLDDSGLIGAS